ncbi:uncharacterized protein E0L32_008348 [Thyridium curvatum]|uniref:C2H2-type domain-containing protein n=1 Tax=Thyridium curvatum TaxID=1093900 RepID=A0A507B0H4_9PEZI|nr:uncharacterized protein E0L32_008348 [Thyridium curvatum]TPX10779.1 hypothetical protein E0L32_008348 [Thyridium curvatum]
MSVVYEARSFIHDGSYPPIGDPHEHDAVQPDDIPRFDDADVSELAAVAASYNAATAPILTEADTRLDLAPPELTKEDSPATSPTPVRIKAIPKPERDIQKNANGMYECSWPSCEEDVKEFSRRCEWNKHMDKHERPYRCLAEGCEKLPGFTYSGGLLRHEREVHNKHGGPKNPLHCPHPNCKRHSGKGFSRQENLNEHLRRVHTGEGGAPIVAGGDDSDEVTSETGGNKRKRTSVGDDGDLREEIKRVRMENEELRRQVEAQNAQTIAMMQQIGQLQQALQPQLQGLGPPTPAASSY